MESRSDRNSPQSAQDPRGHTLSGYLGVREAASYLSVSERFVRTRLSEIPYFKLGKKVLIRRDELDDWMEGFRVHSVKDERDGLDQIADDLAREILN